MRLEQVAGVLNSMIDTFVLLKSARVLLNHFKPSSALRMNASFGHMRNPNQREAASYVSELVLPLGS